MDKPDSAAPLAVILNLLPCLYSSDDSPSEEGKKGICNDCEGEMVMNADLRWIGRHSPFGCSVAAAEYILSAAAPRQPEGPQDLIDEELDVLAEVIDYQVIGNCTHQLILRLLAEVKRRRAQPADAATLVALRRALEGLATKWEAQAYDTDNDRADTERICADELRTALAAAPRDERLDALWHLKRVTDYLDSANIILRDDRPEDADECDEAAAVVAEARAYLAAAAPIGAPDARPDGFQKAGLAQIRLALETAAQVGEIYFQSNALAKGAGERITAALVQLAFLEKQSLAAAASLEVEALDAKLVEIQKLCRNDELDFDPRSGIDRLAADARAVLRRSGRHE